VVFAIIFATVVLPRLCDGPDSTLRRSENSANSYWGRASSPSTRLMSNRMPDTTGPSVPRCPRSRWFGDWRGQRRRSLPSGLPAKMALERAGDRNGPSTQESWKKTHSPDPTGWVFGDESTQQ
jgi:hypothetical protein